MTGTDANKSLIDKAVVKSKDIFNHRKPEDLDFDELQDITEFSHRQLGQFMQFFTNMHCYAMQSAASADLDAQAAKSTLDYMKSKYILLNTGAAKYVIEAQALEDPDICSADAKVFQTKAFNKMMGAQVVALENKVALFSREISRRSSDYTGGKRAN